MAEETVKRVALMMKPSEHKAAKRAAKKLKISFNELVRQSVARHICLNVRQNAAK